MMQLTYFDPEIYLTLNLAFDNERLLKEVFPQNTPEMWFEHFMSDMNGLVDGNFTEH